MTDPKDTLGSYAIPRKAVYIVGAYDRGVTVFSQQVRALNLAWALLESKRLDANHDRSASNDVKEIAIVGGGFSGLTLAAALLKKGVVAKITIFEQRDTLLPLQQGSDSRWLHPRIYDWPAEGSDSSSALLPVLNWTAGRASDVVVQVLSDWQRTVKSVALAFQPTLYCNTRHLQIRESAAEGARVCIEWVGEERVPDTAGTRNEAGTGQSKNFNLVVLAVGFGLEKNGAVSYWRNEMLGQPSLDSPRQTFIISGQGDGAMIDLLRLRISQFRQDRILKELFGGEDELLKQLKTLRAEHAQGSADNALARFEGIEFTSVLNRLRPRLRRDTDVILQLKVREVAELFSHNTTRISFQNKLLIYLLYKCGGFVPTTQSEAVLMQLHGVPASRVIQRHGSDRELVLASILSSNLLAAVKRSGNPGPEEHFRQTDVVCWPGGYFGYPGLEADAASLSDDLKAVGRREYLSGPTAFMAASFCSAIAGVLLPTHNATKRLRVTLHRVAQFGGEEVLQQACDYIGTATAISATSVMARTFPTNTAAIGLAFHTKKIVRTKRNITARVLKKAVDALQLQAAARNMWPTVRCVLALPLLAPALQSTGDTIVIGVLYIDSDQDGYFITNEMLDSIASMCGCMLQTLSRDQAGRFDRLSNSASPGQPSFNPPTFVLTRPMLNAFDLLGKPVAPSAPVPFQFNFDHSDFAMV